MIYSYNDKELDEDKFLTTFIKLNLLIKNNHQLRGLKL